MTVLIWAMDMDFLRLCACISQILPNFVHISCSKLFDFVLDFSMKHGKLCKSSVDW